MKYTWIPVCVAICLLLGSLDYAYPTETNPAEIFKITKAFHKDHQNEYTGLVYFEPPFLVDWKSLAPEWTRLYDPEKNDVGVKRLVYSNLRMFNVSSVYYEYPVNTDMLNKHYYILYNYGIEDLDLTKLVLQVNFSCYQKKISKAGFSGSIAAQLNNKKLQSGGFVICSSQEIQFANIDRSPQFKADIKDGKMAYRYVNDKKEILLNKPATHPSEIDTLYSFNIDGDSSSFIFVKWAEDKSNNYSGCKDSYILFKVNHEIEILNYNFYNCDI